MNFKIYFTLIEVIGFNLPLTNISNRSRFFLENLDFITCKFLTFAQVAIQLQL